MKARLIELQSQQSSSIVVKKIVANHFTTPFHFHDYCELNYVKKSFGKRIVGDHINNFSDGDLVLMSPNLPHVWYNDPEVLQDPSSNCAQAIVTYFPINFLDKLSSDKTLFSKSQNLFDRANRGLLFYGETKNKVADHLERLAKLSGLQMVIEFLKIVDLLLHSKEYESLASMSYSHSFNKKDTERMNQIYKYIINNFKEPISLTTISSIANMTPPAFCNFFKMRVQMSFTKFLNEIRIGHACKLLENEDMSISDVCYESGYQNFTNFNKFFKEITGKTPSQYRKEYLTSINQH